VLAVTNTPKYMCPRCWTAAGYGSKCPNCNTFMVPEAIAPRWDPKQDIRNANVGRIYSAGAIAGAGIGSALGIVLSHGTSSSALATILGFVGLGLAAVVARFWLRHKLAVQTRDALARTALVRIRDAIDGRVHVAGRLRAFASTGGKRDVQLTPGERSEELPGLGLEASGGDFEIDDGSGSVAIIRGAHLRFEVAASMHSPSVLAENLEIEVAGNARWIVASDRHATGSFRAASRVLEIVGSVEEPVLVRLAQSTTARAAERHETMNSEHAASAPRLRVDAADKHTSGTQESSAVVDPAANEAHDSRATR